MSRRPLFPPAVFEPSLSHPLVDDFTLRAQRYRARQQPPGVGATYVLPLRNHGMWSGNNELGLESPFAADANNRQTALKLEEWGPPEVWSVQLGLRFDESQLAGTNGFSIVAHVQAGVGGAVQTFDVDWANGSTFSAVMNALTITAEYDDATDIPSDLMLVATTARGKVSESPPTLTKFMTVAAGPSSEVISIPKFARSVFLCDSGNAGASVYDATSTVFLRPASGGGAGLKIDGDELRQIGGEVPIPNGSRFLQLVNGAAGPAPAMIAVVIFKLAF